MLLLLVLSILAMFLLIGAIGILVALRARETARAFASALASDGDTAALARTKLDEALLKLIRGPSGGLGDVTESLLDDKYGSGVFCQVSGLSTTGSAFITGTVTGLDLSNPAAIAGRVLTFVPAVNDATGPTSYRILRTGTAANTLLLANVKPRTPLPLPAVFPCDALINGREFMVEPYDAFDDSNTFLSQPVIQSSTVASVARPAFGAKGTPCTVDNDGDGVPDGVWLDLPPQASSKGGSLNFKVSYLVLDLDGRINLNAHGSMVRAQVPLTMPVGMGYGPADVDAALAVNGQAAGSSTNRWALLLQGGTQTKIATTSTATQWRPTPTAETTQSGRYTIGTAFATAAPGSGTITTGTNPLNADYWMANSVTGTGNSPTDLKAQLQVSVSGSPPVLSFTRPLSGAWAAGTDVTDVVSTGTNTHPYALRLDDDAPRVAGPGAVDSPFTVGELERIVRQFDADASTLAPRLAALLDDFAERSRMTVTTDSWDTPAITGQAAQALAAMTGAAVYNDHSPEVVAGLRFNLNRPLVSSSARQDYFRHLYNLVRVLGVAPGQAAQWAANVIEFRDPDSTMTRYAYTDPTDGQTKSVWGAERPEMVIVSAPPPGPTDTQVTVTLYRPWRAQLCVGNASTVTGTTERIDAGLGDPTTNTLNAAKAIPGSPPSSVWRLRVVNGVTIPLNSALSGATAVATNTQVGTVTIPLGTGTAVELQRLANPTAAEDSAANPYVTVHAVPFPPGKTSAAGAPAPTRWLHWPNRDFISHGELLAVPSGDPGLIPEAMFTQTETSWLARAQPLILDATIVPSRFAGANVSVASGTTFLAGTGFENFQYGQFSRWREAGRVNVNTILDNTVWSALVGSPGTNPFTSVTARTSADVLLDANVRAVNSDSNSSGLNYRTPIRLANCATTRSHVFAVWITLRITDTSPNAGSPQFARLFAIVDRSIPVGYASGRTLNVRDTVLLQRFLP